jgi:hypothetical protein
MSSWQRIALIICGVTGTAAAQPAPQPLPAPQPYPAPQMSPPVDAAAPAPEKKGPKEPKRGDFDAGGKFRFPSGPDEAGKFDSFNWVALDANGRYYLLDSVFVAGEFPLAVKKPDSLMNGSDPRLIGGMNLRFEGKWSVPKMPMLEYDTEMGLELDASYMREGAMLLSDKDYPLFVGDFQPGIAGGLIMKIKLSSLVDFSLLPKFAFQTGDAENLTAIQIPMSLILKIGSLVKLSTDVGIFTGDDISLRAKNGGRIYLGAALDVKLGPIIAHAGAGFASLLTDEMGAYPTIKDSIYVDLNVKYAK